MRINLPVTNIETKVRDDQYLISKTDLKGRLLYANPAFVEVSGFSREELMGKAHNIIRHPDVPPAAFADLWETLDAGKAWVGMVKNRRKDGGFYWVYANAYPVVENGEVTCYASVRVKPTQQQIDAAQQLFDDFNAGKMRGYTLKGGKLLRRGWRRIIDWAALPFKGSLWISMMRGGAATILTIVIASYFAATGGIPPQWQWGVWALLGLLTAGIVIQGLIITRRISTSLDKLADTARQISAGNLASEIHSGAQDDELDHLIFYLDIMRKSLISISDDVQQGVTATGHTAQILFSSNTNLSTRTEDQATSLQETAAAMEELTVTVKQNADNAHVASKLADDSMRIARQGGEVVSEVVTTMDGIRDSSSKISDIVTLIEGIAFQTNILALNAAVESARAGEAGKSFAVVAGEVRNLALKSSQAAKEIKALIDESSSRVIKGSEQAARAGSTMQDIVDSVQRVTGIITEISTASVEQSSGLEQINKTIGLMDDATQQNAGLVQDLGDTVRTLSSEAQNLGDAIGVLNSQLIKEGRPTPIGTRRTGNGSSRKASQPARKKESASAENRTKNRALGSR